MEDQSESPDYTPPLLMFFFGPSILGISLYIIFRASGGELASDWRFGISYTEYCMFQCVAWGGAGLGMEEGRRPDITARPVRPYRVKGVVSA